METNNFFKDRKFDLDRSDKNLDEKISQEEINQLQEKVFYYAIDDDDIHKKYFLPLAREISNDIKNNSIDKEIYCKKFMPLVNAACAKYYKENKLKKNIKDLFPKKMRVELCRKLIDKSIEDIKNKEYKLESKSIDMTYILREGLALSSDSNYEFIEEYNHRKLYVTREKFQKKYFIAAAANPRTGEAETKESGATKNEAIEKLKNRIKDIENSIPKAPLSSGIDFNIGFSEQLVKDPNAPFYIKIIPGPKLIIAGPTIMEFPELLKDEGFKPAVSRHPGTRYNFFGATRIMGVNELYANGRYIIGERQEDEDGNDVYPLYFDSVVQDTREKIRLREPALTVNSPRISENTVNTVPLSETYERKIRNLISILEKNKGVANGKIIPGSKNSIC